VSTWRPGSIFRKKSIQELWVYSSKLLAASTLNIICRNIYSSLIATYYPFKEAGFYFNANRYSEIPYNTVIPAINTTVYSAMANIGDSSESLKNAFRKTIRVASFAYFPIMLGLIATAEPLMLTVLGTKWLPVVPYFRVLCVGFLFLGMNPFNSIILFLKGKSAVFFNFTLIYNVALLLCIALTLRISVLAMAMSWSITSIIYSVVFTAYIGKMIPYTFGEIIKDILPYFILATVMGVGVYLLSFLIHNPVVLVGMQVLSGAAFYLSATYWLGSKVFREAIGMVKCKISSI
jgi:O-antigen/teichoic acid export membrane protein